MRAVLFMTLVLLAGGARNVVAAEAGPDMDGVLGQLDQVGKDLREFRAKVTLTETDQLGKDVVHAGNIYYQKKPDGNVRLRVVFDQRIANGVKSAERKEYLLDGPVLIDRSYRSKNETKMDVVKPGEKIDLFKLGKGPFPLPIGQDPAEVKKQFEVKAVAPAKDDPPGNPPHLQLDPKPGTELARKFHSLDVFVDPRTHMPVRVMTVDTKQLTFNTTDLQEIVMNPPGGLKDADFQLPNIAGQPGWTFTVNELQR